MNYNQEKAEASFFNSGPDNRIVDIEAGANVTIDKTNPKRPKISASGGGGGGEGGSVDLTNYYNKAEVDAIAETKTDVGHTHTMDNVTGLVAALASKAATTHNHTIANITGLQDALDNLAAGQGGEGGTGGIQETNYVGWDEVTPIKKGDIVYYFDKNNVEHVFLALKNSLNIRPLDNDPSRMAQIEPVMTFDDILVPVAGEVMLKDNFYKESATTPNGDDITFVLKPRNPVEYVDGMGIGIMMGTPQPDIILHIYTGEWEQGAYFKKLGDILNIYTYPMEDQMKSLIRNKKIITTVDGTLYTNDYPLYSESSGYFYERYNKPSIDLYEYYAALGTINRNGQFSKLVVGDGDINIDNYSGYFGGNAKVKLLVGEMDEFNTMEAYLLASDKGIMSGSGIPFYSNYFRSGNFNETADGRILTNKAYVDYKISQIEGGSGGGTPTPKNVSSNIYIPKEITSITISEAVNTDPLSYNNINVNGANVIFVPLGGNNKTVSIPPLFTLTENYSFSVQSLDVQPISFIFDSVDDANVTLIDNTDILVGVGSTATLFMLDGKAYLSVVNI